MTPKRRSRKRRTLSSLLLVTARQMLLTASPTNLVIFNFQTVKQGTKMNLRLKHNGNSVCDSLYILPLFYRQVDLLVSQSSTIQLTGDSITCEFASRYVNLPERG